MRRLMSMKLKLKRNSNTLVTKTGFVHGEAKAHSISTVLAIAVDPKRTGPTSHELNIISKYSRRGESECLKLKKSILEYLTLSEDCHNFTEVHKILAVLDFVFITGSREFYYLFVNGDRVGDSGEGVWKLKVLHETVAGPEDVVERIRTKVSELLWMCQDHQHWEDRCAEYEAIRQEIHMPSSRRSFDSIGSDRSSILSSPTSPVMVTPSLPQRTSSLHRRLSLAQISEADELTSAATNF